MSSLQGLSVDRGSVFHPPPKLGQLRVQLKVRKTGIYNSQIPTLLRDQFYLDATDAVQMSMCYNQDS